MLKKNNIDEKSALELEQAKHFMRWVTLHEPSRIKRLDKKKDRKRPEFAFYYASGQRYTLELTRWLTPELRELQNLLESNVAEPLGNSLHGTFILNIPLEELKGSRIPKNEAKNLVSEIQRIGSSDMKGQTCPLSIGAFSKVRDDGHRLVPMVSRPELPVYLDEHNQEVKILRKKLEDILLETDEKFRYYRGIRVLLIDISQCGLDIDYHAGISKEGPGIVCKWLAAFLKPTRIDYVCLDQGVRLWHGGNRGRILTGHKYVDKPSANPREVWHRPGLLPITSSYIS